MLFLQAYDKKALKFEEKLTKALKENQHGFVKLFLKNGVIIAHTLSYRKNTQRLIRKGNF